MQLNHIYHLYRRAAFGILPGEVELLNGLSREECVDRLFEASEAPTMIDIGLEEFDALFKDNKQPRVKQFRSLVLQTKERHLELNSKWLDRMIYSTQGLNERMTLFWANIFVCRDNVITFIQQYNNTLREHALGSFSELVKAVSREPAMMKYLNTNQNVQREPNENFARELMELFTLGEGNYSETDIKEAARAFTGYNFRLDGSFRFAYRHHDFGEKEFFGWKGNFQGDDIIDIICNEKACANYICQRLYRYFVSDRQNDDHILEMTEVFYRNYEIKDVLRHMFLSDWFYDDSVVGNKIKSPIDLLVSINRIVPYEFENPKKLVFVQRLLGQSPLQPPNVAGWEGGRSWINSNTLMLRMKLPSLLVGNGIIPSSELSAEFGKRYFGEKLTAVRDWSDFDEKYGKLDRVQLALAICGTELNPGSKELLSKYENLGNREYAIQLMSLPEFQLS